MSSKENTSDKSSPDLQSIAISPIDLNNCKPGDRLEHRNGKIFVYIGPTTEGWHAMYREGNPSFCETRRFDGALWSDGFSDREDIIRVIPADYSKLNLGENPEKVIKRLYDFLIEIHNAAHNMSTGPEVPDGYWQIRKMACDALNTEGGTK